MGQAVYLSRKLGTLRDASEGEDLELLGDHRVKRKKKS